MIRRWTLKEKAAADTVQNLSSELGIDLILAGILAQRGICNFKEAKHFFRPCLDQLHDPFLMKDMDKAITRIEKAIRDKEKILIYGDYDVDGTTAVALTYSFFKKIHSDIEYYIPDRYSEGYGISFTGIDWARERGFSLVIALDCGIKAIDKITYATQHKIDFIICDHHRPGNEIPKAAAVLDPKRADCNYPFKELSGCGIGFKLIQAYLIKNNLPAEQLEPFLDLLVVSIAADIVPVVDENRVLSFYGLKRINLDPRHGFKAMLELANVKRELILNDLVFIIGPRINAAGRLENGKSAVALLLCENELSATFSGQHIDVTNSRRRDLDVKITEEALEMIRNSKEMIDRKTTVLFHKEWHKGVIGIVASRLIEKYYRPTIVLTESNGMVSGSARSVKDFDVYEAIEACSHLLEQFGGHKYAAGLTMKLENVAAFRKKFEEVVCSTIEDHLLTPEIEIDANIELVHINQKFMRILKQLAPFGPGNPAPIFLTKNVVDTGGVHIVGSNHLRMDIRDQKNPKEIFPAIAFGRGDLFSEIYLRKPFDICYSIEENQRNGNTVLQLNVKDIKI
jgi:single-stranded-DNA-specific exonuclease